MASKSKLRYYEARRKSDNWISSLCGIDELEPHGLTAAEIDSELTTAGEAYLKDLIFRLGYLAGLISKRTPKKVVSAYNDGELMRVKLQNELSFMKIRVHTEVDHGWLDLLQLLSPDQKEEYLEKGVDVAYAVRLGKDDELDFSKLFYTAD